MMYMTIREFAKRTGISVTTLRRWDRKGILKPLKTPTGFRKYTEEMIAAILKQDSK